MSRARSWSSRGGRHGPGEVAEVAPDLALHGGHREGAEGGAVVGVEAIHRLDQTQCRDLSQVLERHSAAAGEAPRDRIGEREIRSNQAIYGRADRGAPRRRESPPRRVGARLEPRRGRAHEVPESKPERRGRFLARFEEGQQVRDAGDLKDAARRTGRADDHERRSSRPRTARARTSTLTPREARKSTSHRSTTNSPRVSWMAVSRTSVSRGPVSTSTSPRTRTPGAPRRGAR